MYFLSFFEFLSVSDDEYHISNVIPVEYDVRDKSFDVLLHTSHRDFSAEIFSHIPTFLFPSIFPRDIPRAF